MHDIFFLMYQNNKQNPEYRIYITCKFLFCFWSDTESQLHAVCSFFLICLCVADKSVKILTFGLGGKLRGQIALNVIDKLSFFNQHIKGTQWLSDRVLNSTGGLRARSSPISLSCVLEQDTLILAKNCLDPERPVLTELKYY